MAITERPEVPEPHPAVLPQAERDRTPEPLEKGVAEERIASQAETPSAAPPAPAPAASPQPAATEMDPLLEKVETILSDDLGELYAKLDPLTKKEFKEEGEVAARSIRTLLADAKVQAQRILKIIATWLKIIPGVSRLFIEQEAKRKTDRLLALHRKELDAVNHEQ